MKPRALIMAGFGINCEIETEVAFKRAGADTKCMHLNDIIKNRSVLDDSHIIALPGGFSFGDDIGSGKVFANKLKYNLEESLKKFVSDGKLIIGICNGFQSLVKAGLLPMNNGFRQEVTLTFNDSGKFEDRWVYMKAEKNSKCVFIKGIDSIYLPVRHGEGKFVASPEKIKFLKENNQVALYYTDSAGSKAGYPWNPNGSMENIAGICNKSGRIFGLMPHPEACLNRTNHPRWTRGERSVLGIKIFENAVGWVKDNFA